MQSILGIDVSKDKLDLILMANGKKYHRVISNDLKGFLVLDKWLKFYHVEDLHACLEATGQYGEPVAEWLYKQGHQVSVVNPARIKRYGESKLHRNKTDKADADLIAEFCLKEKPVDCRVLSEGKNKPLEASRPRNKASTGLNSPFTGLEGQSTAGEEPQR